MQFAERPSRNAAARLGFRYEGLFRQATGDVKGRNRDTAWFSIIDSEWPALRGAFERWLDPANFDRRRYSSAAASRASARHRMTPRRTPSLALLSAVTALAFCALHMVVPALPLLAVAFDDSAARVQLVLSLISPASPRGSWFTARLPTGSAAARC